MSILIKGMKMPESCVDCPMFDWDLEYLKCKANGKYFKANGEWRKGIESTCPLIEVPEDVQPVRWIPVTERLPESVRKSYLCLTDTGYHCEVRWTNNVYGLWKSDNKWGWSIADVPQYCKVTHWMPLPKPPKDGET